MTIATTETHNSKNQSPRTFSDGVRNIKTFPPKIRKVKNFSLGSLIEKTELEYFSHNADPQLSEGQVDTESRSIEA